MKGFVTTKPHVASAKQLVREHRRYLLLRQDGHLETVLLTLAGESVRHRKNHVLTNFTSHPTLVASYIKDSSPLEEVKRKKSETLIVHKRTFSIIPINIVWLKLDLVVERKQTHGSFHELEHVQ